MAKDRAVLRQLWAHPLKNVARTRKQTPEAWHAECLSDERDQLQTVVRALEFDQGFGEGVRVVALATRAFEKPTGETTESPNSGTHN